MAAAHPELLWIVILSGIVCTILAISIGANDVANAFSTSVGSGTLSLRGAITIAFIFEVLGSITLGGRVSDSIRTRILNFSAFADRPHELALGMLCSSIGATSWLMFATFFGIPVSTTHSIIGALAGFGVASGRFNGVRWIQLLYIILSWFIVPVLSIIVTAALYIMLQEFVLKRRHSYKFMKNYHWIFLALFSIPLSIFIAFENSLLRSTSAAFADSYRKWFDESNWNKALSVFIVLMGLIAISSCVTYTICHVRMKSGWSFLKSYRSIDALFSTSKKTQNEDALVENVDSISNLNIHDSHHTLNKNNSDMLVTNTNSLNTVVINKSQDDSDFILTMNRNGSMDVRGEDSQDEFKDVPKKSFSKSVLDVLLSSVGFPQTPRDSRSPSDSSINSISYENDEESGPEGNMNHMGSKLNRFMNNIRSSYSSSMSKLSKLTNINNTTGSIGSGSIDISRSMNGHEGSTNRHPRSNTRVQKNVVRHGRGPSSLNTIIHLSPQRRKEMNDTQTIFSAMQIVGATISIISHSANDTANAVSTFATVYFLYFDGLENNYKNTPWYILLCGGLSMALGLALFGYKVIKTVGMNITRVTPSRGYTIDCTAGGIVLILSHLGIPLSSTHVTVSAILGIGMIHHVPPCYNPNLKDFKEDSMSTNNLDKEGVSGPSERYHPLDPNYPDFSSNVHNYDNGADSGFDEGVDNMESQKDDYLIMANSSIRDRFTTEYVNLKLYRKIFFTWIITIFSSGVVTAVFFLIAKAIYNAKK